MKNRLVLTILFLSGTLGSVFSAAPLDATPFQVVGHLQKFTLETTGDPLSGARITVNGTEVIVPRNLLIQMPGTFLTAADLFDLAPAGATQRTATGACGGPKASGLALDDCPAPLAAFEVSISGNIVDDRHLAGLVQITQQSLNLGQGYIQAVDFNNGELLVGAVLDGPVKARVRINDSDGRFGRKTSALNVGETPLSQDGRFTADTESPTIHSANGYPMCIPRSAADPRCPQKNRGPDPNNPLQTFVMPSPGAATAAPLPNFPAAVPCNACDPREQAPFMKGDYIDYSGTLARDATGFYISAHTIEAWVGIYTQPGTEPAYLTVGEVLIRSGGQPFPDGRVPPGTIAQEVATRGIRIEGFTTDPSSDVVVYAIDTDQCTGSESLRFLTPANPADQPVFGRFRNEDRRDIGTPTREVIAYIRRVAEAKGLLSGDRNTWRQLPELTLAANGLPAGQYRAPITEYIFPENRIFGDPLIPLNLQDFDFLARGSGPLATRGRTGGPVVGQLNPWPGGASRRPPAVTCP
ncbi:MAG TPA: hypothetical protein VJ302_06405 [Blastocatellia bacterium]|nr:hypothetical protein [Blastocatellia bacterium]